MIYKNIENVFLYKIKRFLPGCIGLINEILSSTGRVPIQDGGNPYEFIYFSEVGNSSVAEPI